MGVADTSLPRFLSVFDLTWAATPPHALHVTHSTTLDHLILFSAPHHTIPPTVHLCRAGACQCPCVSLLRGSEWLKRPQTTPCFAGVRPLSGTAFTMAYRTHHQTARWPGSRESPQKPGYRPHTGNKEPSCLLTALGYPPWTTNCVYPHLIPVPIACRSRVVHARVPGPDTFGNAPRRAHRPLHA